jgi:signal transduction histidine kinase
MILTRVEAFTRHSMWVFFPLLFAAILLWQEPLLYGVLLTLPMFLIYYKRTRRETERLHKEQRELSAKLQVMQQREEQLISNLSHDLRTPLNSILNFTDFVRRGMLGDINEQQINALDKSLESGRYLLALINNTLDSIKIESGTLKLFVETNINIQDELAALSATAKTLLNDKPVQVVEDFDRDLPLLTGDRRRIRQVLLNLLSNAARVTESGSITFSVKKQEDELLFAIIDTGPGMALEEQTGHANKELGLPILKWLVEAHGGKLWLESAPGEGSAFYVTLPHVKQG